MAQERRQAVVCVCLAQERRQAVVCVCLAQERRQAVVCVCLAQERRQAASIPHAKHTHTTSDAKPPWKTGLLRMHTSSGRVLAIHTGIRAC